MSCLNLETLADSGAIGTAFCGDGPLGRILERLIDEGGNRRVVISGGDTAGDICTVLGINALSALAPTIPGASIRRAHASGQMDGLEITLKGGQMGSDEYFDWVRNGGGERT